MVDLMFDLAGGTLPSAYPFALWAALLRHVPQLEEEKSVGILPLRGTINSEGLLLSRRAKLVVRLPATLAANASSRLTDQQLDIDGNIIRLGAAKTRTIQPYPTIHAQLVTGGSDEVLFTDDIKRQLGELDISGKLICGKRLGINGCPKSILGYSLVLHDLKAEASLQLQYLGLGDERHFGCGIFVPYKVISGLSED